MKIGKEVEGRHIGLRTLFCSADEFMNQLQKVGQVADEWGVHQIYISDLDNELDISDLNVVLGTWALNYIITVECTIVPEYVGTNINIMLNIDKPSFWNLRRGDQIKFSKDLTVYSASFENMTLTVPEDFSGDVEID